MPGETLVKRESASHPVGAHHGEMQSTKITSALDVGQHLLNVPRRVVAGQSPRDHVPATRRSVVRVAPETRFLLEFLGTALDQIDDLADHPSVRCAADGLEPRVEALGQVDAESFDGLGVPSSR